MSIEGQGHFFTIYFPGFVCFVLYWAKISGERLQDHWSSGLDLLHTWVKGCFKKIFGKTLYFSYFFFLYSNVLHRLIMKK